MNPLLQFSHGIDALNLRIGRSAIWLILIAVLISTINAIVRKLFNVSSNAFLEMQWYLFAGVFLLCGPYALLKNAHVRIDVLSSHLSQRTRVMVEIFALIFFLMPMAVVILWLSWPVFVTSFVSGEVSPNAGGLIVWPARFLIPAGFALLILQGVSQIIKCLAFLSGQGADPTQKEEGPSAEEELAKAIRNAATEKH